MRRRKGWECVIERIKANTCIKYVVLSSARTKDGYHRLIRIEKVDIRVKRNCKKGILA